MKQHIDTAPLWESYREDCECPLCLLNAKAEASNVDYFLGESVMEPSQRIEVNQKGFCARHFKMMYDAGNRLGLALMTQTYMRETVKFLRENADKARTAAAEEAGKPIFKRIGGKRGASFGEVTAELKGMNGQCLMCRHIRESMDRYIYTLLYMYRHEPEFPKLFSESKGMCLKHYAETLEAAPKHLAGDTLTRFVDTLTGIELKNFERLEDEIDWFTQKFDYRNQDKPWGNSRDAVKRSVNKLRWQVVEDNGK